MTDETSRRQFLTKAALSAALVQTGSAAPTGLPTRILGKTGQRVSIICLGGWHIGAVPDEKEAIRIMHAAIDEGINFFDNAWDYHDGVSEVRRARRWPWMGAAARFFS